MRAERNCKVALYVGLTALLATGPLRPAVAQDIYWTGAADNYWGNTNNWNTSALPGTNSTVILGHPDYAVSNRAYEVILDAEPIIHQIHFAGTDERVVTLRAAADEKLTVTGDRADAVSMLSTATAQGFIDMYIHANGDKPHLSNHSTNALLVIDTHGTFQASSPDRSGNGDIEVRGFLSGNFANRYGTGTTILNTEGRDFATSWGPAGGMVLALKSDSRIIQYLTGAGRSEVVIVESGDADRSLTVGLHVRGGDTQVLALAPSPDGSTGHLTLRARRWRENTMQIETYTHSTVELYAAETMYYSTAGNPGISGTGHMRLSLPESDHVYSVQRAMTYTGRTMLETGTLRLASATVGEVTHRGQLPPGTIAEIGAQATLNLNGIDQTVGGLSDYRGRDGLAAPSAGTVLLNGASLTIMADEASSFGGSISGTGAVIKAGAETFTLAAGYTNAADRVLRAAGGVLAVTGALSVEEGDFELAGGRLTAGSLASSGTVWNVTLYDANEDQVLVDVTGNADISDAVLNLELAGGYAPAYGTEYTLLYAAGTITGAAKGGLLFGIQDGDSFFQNDQEYEIRWRGGSGQIVLTAIPEPGSLVLLALAAAGLLALHRRKG